MTEYMKHTPVSDWANKADKVGDAKYVTGERQKNKGIRYKVGKMPRGVLWCMVRHALVCLCMDVFVSSSRKRVVLP